MKRLHLSLAVLTFLLTASVSNAQLTPDFNASPKSGCVPFLTGFAADTVNWPTASYTFSWNLGNGPSTYAGPTVSTIYSTLGKYTVTITATDKATAATYVTAKTDYIEAFDKPIIAFTGSPLNGCVPLPISFTPNVTPNAVGIAGYQWDFGDGSPFSSDSTPMHTYTLGGPFTVKLTVTNTATCARQLILTNYVNPYPLPTAAFSANQTIFCGAPATAAFTNSSSGIGPLSASWIFGDGHTGSGNTALNMYNTSGFYTVNMTVTDGHACQSTASIPDYIRVYGAPAAFSTTTPYCRYDSITFTNTTASTALSNTRWNFGDGNMDTGFSVKHPYLSAGSYTVIMTTTDGACPNKQAARIITVNPKPATSISYTPLYPCPPPDTVTYSDTTSPGLIHRWDFPEGDTLYGSTVKHGYSTVGYKTVRLITTDPATGCASKTEFDSVAINALYGIAVSSPGNGCRPLTATLSVNLVGSVPPGTGPPPYPLPAISWNYVIPGGSIGSSTLEHPVVTWDTFGTFIVTASGMTANGCSYTATMSSDGAVRVGHSVPASFSVDTEICANTLDTFFNTGATIGKWYWFTGEGHVGDWGHDTIAGFSAYWNHYNRDTFIYNYPEPGAYRAVRITFNDGCTDSMVKLIIVHPARAVFGYVRDCWPGLTVHFVDSSRGPTGWYWDFGDGSVGDTTQNPSHTYAAPGNYRVKLTALNSTYGCDDTMVKMVRLANPAPDFSVDKDTLCVGDLITFTAAFSSDRPTLKSWYLDNDTRANFSLDPTERITIDSPGYHNMRLVITSGDTASCYDTVYKQHVAFAYQPVARFSIPPLGCRLAPITFIDSSSAMAGRTIASRYWNFGDSTSLLIPGSSAGITHTYRSNHRDTIFLVITDDLGCQVQATRYIDIRRPVADFVASKTTVCRNDSLLFLSDSSKGIAPLSYQWNFGDGTGSSAKSPSHIYTQRGTDTVMLIVTDPTPCADTLIRRNYIHVLAPHAAFSMDSTFAVCPPLPVNFTNLSTGASSYLWDFGKGALPIPGKNVSSTYDTAGQYTIVLTAIDTNGCTDTAQGRAYVLGYKGSFSYTPVNACVGQEIQFSAVVNNIPKVTWAFNDGTYKISAGGATSHAYTSAGVYHPTVIYSNGPGCSSFDSGTIPIHVDKASAGFSASTPCIGAPFTLTQTSSAVYDAPVSWQWLLSPKDTGSGPRVTYTAHMSGLYPITLIATNSWGCKDSITKNIFINPLPLIDAGPADTGICPGDTIRLIGHGGKSYVWSSAANILCPSCDTALVYTALPTTYYLAGTDSDGCVNRDSIVARIQIKTTDSVLPGGEICIGETFRLVAFGATSYKWSPVAFLDSPDIASPLAKPIITTKYVLEAQEGTCLVAFDTIKVVVHPAPYFDAGNDELINYGSSVMLHPTRSGISRIEWRPDTTLSCLSCFDPLAHPSYSTVYYATGYSEYGCVAYDSVTVRVRCNGDSVFIPNTFTPNGDGLNDYFYPRGKGVTRMASFRIYDRWGELVFERLNFALNDEQSGWNGTFKGKALPPDVYVYTMSTRCVSGEPLEWKGDITLVR